jgi:hypothetical protein
MSQVELLQQLRQTDDPTAARDLALELLRVSHRREMVDAALHTLQDAALTDDARPVLRAAALYYFEHDDRDNGALIREKLLRLLATLEHPEDADLFLRGVTTYEVEPMMGEVTQNLRAISLVGLALSDPDLAQIHATRLLSEIESTSQFSGEPAVTAINLLAQQRQTLPIYQFLLLGGIDALEAGQYEVVGKALESLGSRFPVDLYQQLTDLFLPRDRAVVSMGIITHIVENQVSTLYPLLDTILTSTRHDELHNYGVVMMAASRVTALEQQLFRLARLSTQQRLPNFIAALELVPGDEKDELLADLRRRLS